MMSKYSVLLIFCLFNQACSRSLTDLVCRINPSKCGDFKGQRTRNEHIRKPEDPNQAPISTFGGPSLEEFKRWNSYEQTAQGTGFLTQPESGNNPVPYGPGLGDIGIFTDLGVQYGVGSFNYQRDFGIAMGGSGRIGGIPVGWGNGNQRQIGSAPWMHP